MCRYLLFLESFVRASLLLNSFACSERKVFLQRRWSGRAWLTWLGFYHRLNSFRSGVRLIGRNCLSNRNWANLTPVETGSIRKIEKSLLMP